MKRDDTKYILGKIQAVDNRTITEETVASWHEIVGHLAFDVAERALLKARQDPAINWVEPRHIVGKAREAIVELNEEARQLARSAEADGRAEPEPICEVHRRRITTCAECCRRLAVEAGHLSGDRLHEWAIVNVYVQEPF